MTNRTITTVLLDVDGTLVDSNDAHAQAWVRAFAEHDVTVHYEEIRRAIGMGGDQLMPRVSDIEEESERGQAIAKRRREIFTTEFLPTLKPLRGAGELVAAIAARGYKTVAASSAQAEELERLLEIAGAGDLLDATTSSDDAEASKPAPDIIQAALGRAGVDAEAAIMIGDTPYDIEAARRARVPTLAFRSGGWNDTDLQGAVAIYDGPWDLLVQLDNSPLAIRAATKEPR